MSSHSMQPRFSSDRRFLRRVSCASKAWHFGSNLDVPKVNFLLMPG